MSSTFKTDDAQNELGLIHFSSIEQQFVALLLSKMPLYQKRIKICETNIQTNKTDIEKYRSDIKEKEIELWELRDKYSAVMAVLAQGEFPIELQQRVAATEYKFTSFPTIMFFPDELDENTIYLKKDLKEKALFYKLKDNEKTVCGLITINQLEFIKNTDEGKNSPRDFEKLSIEECWCNLLCNIVKNGHYNPYEKEIKKLELLLQDADKKLQESKAAKAMLEEELAILKQELAVIQMQFNRLTEKRPQYQLEIVQSDFFATSARRFARPELAEQISKEDFSSRP